MQLNKLVTLGLVESCCVKTAEFLVKSTVWPDKALIDRELI